MGKRFTLGLSIALIITMTGVGASGQTATGNVYGKVSDDAGAVLPGASVEIAGEDGVRSTLSGGDGAFRFLNLDPGEYSLTVSMQGFGAANRKVLIQTGQSATLTFTLAVGGRSESAAANAAVPLVDLTTRGTGTTLSAQDLRSIPNARDPWAVMSQVPGVNIDRVNIAGNEGGGQSNLSGKGGVEADNVWSLDGIVVTDQTATGSSPSQYDFDALQEIHVSTGGADVTHQTGGFGINLVSKRGVNVFHGGARMLTTDSKWEASNLPDELRNDPRLLKSLGHCIPEEGATTPRDKGDSVDNIREYGFDLGGPLVKDKLWFFASYGRQNIKLCRFSGDPDDALLNNYSLKINWRASSKTRVSAFWFHGAKERFGRSPGLAATEAEGVLWDERDESTDGGLPPGLSKIQIDHTFSPNFFLSAKAAYFDAGFGLVSGGAQGQGYTIDYAAGEAIGTIYSSSPVVRPQKTGNLDGRYFFEGLGGGHELKFGLGYRNAAADATTHYSGLTGYYYGQFSGGGNNVALASRDGRQVYEATYTSAYLGDVFTKDRFSLNVGLRLDKQKSKNGSSSVPANPDFPDRLPALSYGGTDYLVDFTDISPRISLSYALGEARKTVARVSVARYASQLGASVVTAVNPLAPGGLAYDWNDRNGDRLVQKDEVGSVLKYAVAIDPNNPAALGSSPNVIDPDLKNQHDLEGILGLDHELGENFAVGGALTFRKSSDFGQGGPVDSFPRLAAPCSTGLNCQVIQPGQYLPLAPISAAGGGITGTVQPFAPDPNLVDAGNNGRYITNREGYSRIYKGIELTLNKRLSNKWGGRVALAFNDWTEHWTGAPTSSTLNPTRLNIDPLIDGGPVSLLSGGSGKAAFYSSYKWSFYMNGVVQLPANFDLSAQVIGRQGGTFPVSVNTAMGDDAIGELLVGNTDDRRYDNLWNVDIRLARLGKMGRLTVSPTLEVFNVLNSGLVLSKARNLGSQTFGRIEEIINPRVLRISTRISF